jgi:hypothetical protein
MTLQLEFSGASLTPATEAEIETEVIRTLIEQAAADGITVTAADFADIIITVNTRARREFEHVHPATMPFAARARREFESNLDRQRRATLGIEVVMVDSFSNELAVGMAESIFTATSNGATLQLDVVGYEFAIAGVTEVVLLLVVEAENKSVKGSAHDHDHNSGKHTTEKSSKVSEHMKSVQVKSASASKSMKSAKVKSASAIKVQSTASGKAGKSADAIKLQSTASSGKAGKSAAQAARLQSIKASPTSQGIQQMLLGVAAFVGVVAVAKQIRNRRRQQGAAQEELQPILYTSPSPGQAS